MHWVWVISAGLCLGCFGATAGGGNDQDEDDGQGGGGAAPTAGTGGSASTAGTGSIFGGGSSSTGGSSTSGSGGSVAMGGSSPAGGTSSVGAECTDLALVPTVVECSTVAALPSPSGGVIAEGTYALIRTDVLDSAACGFSFDYTVRVTSLGLNNYGLELVLDLVDLRASGTFTTSGTSMTTTITCMSDDTASSAEPSTIGYAAYDELGVAHFQLFEENTIYTFAQID